VAPESKKVEKVKQITQTIYTTDKVWVVDDDQLILDLCDIIFSKQAIDHLCFSSPLKMLESDWDPAVKFILMDMRMPELSGVELCHLMREKIPADVKIYAMTAQVLPEELEEVLNQGFDGLIMKPFRESDLLVVFNNGEVIIADKQDFSSIQLDTSVIEKMTFGDEELLLKILNRFKDDCLIDTAELEKSLTDNDQPLARLIVHRIAGRTAQMGSGKLAADFREMEIEIAGKQNMDDDLKLKIRELISGLHFLMTLVDKKIK